MKRYITVDEGTTNLRLCLLEDGVLRGRVRRQVGASSGMTDKNIQKSAIREGIEELLSETSLTETDVDRVLACGMITSEYGLLEIPHLLLPAGRRELHQGMVKKSFPEITGIPFVFVPGLRTGSRELAHADMMRGEETELFGLSGDLTPGAAYLLPGTHSKAVFIDENARVDNFETFLTGEMLSALMKGTILSSAVSFQEQVHAGYLFQGFEMARTYGLNYALFKVRILKNLFQGSDLDCYSFFLGAVLEGETSRLLSLPASRYIAAGKKELKEPMALLLRKYGSVPVTSVSEEQNENAAAFGLIRIYESKA